MTLPRLFHVYSPGAPLAPKPRETLRLISEDSIIQPLEKRQTFKRQTLTSLIMLESEKLTVSKQYVGTSPAPGAAL